jgi:hypothetical protein
MLQFMHIIIWEFTVESGSVRNIRDWTPGLRTALRQKKGTSLLGAKTTIDTGNWEVRLIPRLRPLPALQNFREYLS